MKRGRYTTVDNWEIENVVRPPYWDGEGSLPLFVIEACDVREVNGTIWHGGGRRVTCQETCAVTASHPAGIRPAKVQQGFRAKTFIGETAWSEAERYATDWAYKAARLARDAAYR